MASPPYISQKEVSFHTAYTLCTEGKTFTDPMPSSSSRSDGCRKRVFDPGGDICHSMADRVSQSSNSSQTNIICLFLSNLPWQFLPSLTPTLGICVGQQFALTEASYTIIRLLQEFRAIENRDPGEWVENFNITLATGGVKVAMIPR